MAVTVLNGGIENTDADVVFRERAKHAAKVDPKDSYKNTTMSVGTARDRRDVVLRYPAGGTFVFACLVDNPKMQSEGTDLWRAFAVEAIEKFAAMRNNRITFGPRNEDMNRFNVMAELAGRIE